MGNLIGWLILGVIANLLHARRAMRPPDFEARLRAHSLAQIPHGDQMQNRLRVHMLARRGLAYVWTARIGATIGASV